MARRTFKGDKNVINAYKRGAFVYPYPAHPVDGGGYPSIPVGPWLDHGLSEFLSDGSSTNMAADGSVTPVEFELVPPDGKVYIIASMMFLANQAGTTTTNFFGAAALSTGCLLKVERGESERFDFFNGDAATITRDFMKRWSIPTVQQPVGTWQTTQIHIPLHHYYGKYFELDGNLSDRIVFTVQDNLTGIAAMTLLVNGWEEDSV